MKDYSDMFPVEPIIGWGTTNYRDRSKNGLVQQYQGFKGYTLTGERFPSTSYERDMIVVPEGRFYTSEDFFQPTPEQAIKQAIDHVRRINADATRILESVRQVQKEQRITFRKMKR